MLSYKNYSRGLCLVLFSTVFSPLTANAGVTQCWQWLSSQTKPYISGAATESAPPRMFEAQYKSFLREKRANPHATPHVRLYTNETTVSDLLLNFDFWWFEGNQYHADLVNDYPSVIELVREQQLKTNEILPPAESLPSVDTVLAALREEDEAIAADAASFIVTNEMTVQELLRRIEELRLDLLAQEKENAKTISVALPSEGDFVRPNEADHQKFIEERKRIPNAVPDSHVFFQSTKKEELLYDFAYWWFAGNIWNEVLLHEYPDLKENVSTMMEQQESIGADLPALDTLPPRQELLLAFDRVDENKDKIRFDTTEEIKLAIQRLQRDEEGLPVEIDPNANIDTSTSYGGESPHPNGDHNTNAGTDGASGPQSSNGLN